MSATWLLGGLSTEKGSVASITTPVGRGLPGKHEPRDMHDILLVRFYLHRVAVMARPRIGTGNKGLAAHRRSLMSSAAQLADTRNDADLETKIKIYQGTWLELARDGRVSVWPGNSADASGGYADRSGLNGRRGYTMAFLIMDWQALTVDTKEPRALSLQTDCPLELKAALGHF